MVKLNINGTSVEMTVSELKEYLSEENKVDNIVLDTLDKIKDGLKRDIPYTLTELRLIKRCISNGVNYKEIARRLNRPAPSVAWMSSMIRTGKKKVR